MAPSALPAMLFGYPKKNAQDEHRERLGWRSGRDQQKRKNSRGPMHSVFLGTPDRHGAGRAGCLGVLAGLPPGSLS